MAEFSTLLFLLFLLSMFFSGSESAIFSLSESKVAVLEQKEKEETQRSRKWLLELLKNKNRTLSAILLGNLFVNMALSEILNKVFSERFEMGPIQNLVVITILLLVFAEILPKLLAIRKAEKWSITVSPLMRSWEAIVSRISEPLNRLSLALSRLLPEPPKSLPEEKLMEALEYADQQNLLDAESKSQLSATVDFHFDTVYSVMIPRSEILIIPHDLTPTQAKKTFLEAGAELAVVYNDRSEEYIGSLSLRSLLPAVLKKQKSIRSRIRFTPFFPEKMGLPEALQKLIDEQCDVGIAIDEAGNLTGLLAIREIFGKLLGESEEFEQQSGNVEEIKKLSNNKYLLSGQLPLYEFNQHFDAKLQSKNAETIAGYLIEELDGFPRSKTVLKRSSFRFSQMKMEAGKIDTIICEISL